MHYLIVYFSYDKNIVSNTETLFLWVTIVILFQSMDIFRLVSRMSEVNFSNARLFSNFVSIESLSTFDYFELRISF